MSNDTAGANDGAVKSFIAKFVADMRALGITPDDTLMVHSSLKSFGRVEGGAETVIRALIATLPEGTLMLPALSYEYVTYDHPKFSVMDTPSCVGIISETFRKYPGVIRSLHPKHSVCAYGVNAARMTARHGLDRSPVGENSPFRLLKGCGGKIVMLGCGLKPNTFMHGVEEAARLPYVLAPEPTPIAIEDKDGNVEIVNHYVHHFDGYDQRYDRAAECVNVRRGNARQAETCVIDAAELWEAATEKVRREPFFFVDRID